MTSHTEKFLKTSEQVQFSFKSDNNSGHFIGASFLPLEWLWESPGGKQATSAPTYPCDERETVEQ
jgi:hypothetical protein